MTGKVLKIFASSFFDGVNSPIDAVAVLTKETIVSQPVIQISRGSFAQDKEKISGDFRKAFENERTNIASARR